MVSRKVPSAFPAMPPVYRTPVSFLHSDRKLNNSSVILCGAPQLYSRGTQSILRRNPPKRYPPSARLRRVTHPAFIHGVTLVAFREGG